MFNSKYINIGHAQLFFPAKLSWYGFVAVEVQLEWLFRVNSPGSSFLLISNFSSHEHTKTIILCMLKPCTLKTCCVKARGHLCRWQQHLLVVCELLNPGVPREQAVLAKCNASQRRLQAILWKWIQLHTSLAAQFCPTLILHEDEEWQAVGLEKAGLRSVSGYVIFLWFFMTLQFWEMLAWHDLQVFLYMCVL